MMMKYMTLLLNICKAIKVALHIFSNKVSVLCAWMFTAL